MSQIDILIHRLNFKWFLCGRTTVGSWDTLFRSVIGSIEEWTHMILIFHYAYINIQVFNMLFKQYIYICWNIWILKDLSKYYFVSCSFFCFLFIKNVKKYNLLFKYALKQISALSCDIWSLKVHLRICIYNKKEKWAINVVRPYQ